MTAVFELTSAYDYELPRELIAQQPAPRRDASRLMILRRACPEVEHRRFFNLPDYLEPGDVLVLNDSRVLPAKVIGRRATGGKLSGLFLSQNEAGRARMMLQARGKLRTNEELSFADGKLKGRLVEKESGGIWQVDFEKQDVLGALETIGRAPLPPYIRRPVLDDPSAEADLERYQTVYGRTPGSIAAPTAGLHFTEELLQRIIAKGIKVTYLTLHVGLGTFAPVRTERIQGHHMHAERFSLTEECAALINQAKNSKQRVVAVGTSTVRVLEHLARQAKAPYRLRAGTGESELFIHPPFEFRVVDVFLTNFHLPRSSTLLLACAFASREKILSAYEQAKLKRYRFYSFGDAMLIL